MDFHKLPRTIESNYKTMSQEVLKRWQGEIDRYVNDAYPIKHSDDIGVNLPTIIRTDAFRLGSYVGLNSIIWRVTHVAISNKLMYPPIPFATLRLERYNAPAQTTQDPTEG